MGSLNRFLQRKENPYSQKDSDVFIWLDGLEKRGELDLENPPEVWAITFQRWLLQRRGVKWLADYLKRKDYADCPENIPDRLKILGAPHDEIDMAMGGKEILKTKVAGVTFGNRQKALERLTYYAPEEIMTVLVPEPENQYDENAIAVKVFVNSSKESYCIGYISKTETGKVKPFVSRMPELKITHGGIYNAELRIAVQCKRNY